MTAIDLKSLRKSILRAMHGNKEKNLSGLMGEIHGTTIILTAYFSVQPTEDNIEEFKCMGTEVIADYTEPYMIEEKWQIGEPKIEDGKSVWVVNLI